MLNAQAPPFRQSTILHASFPFLATQTPRVCLSLSLPLFFSEVIIIWIFL